MRKTFMSLKSFISIASAVGLVVSTPAHSSVREECECKKIKRTDHVFSHNHFIMMDYSLDSFDYIGEDRYPQTMMGSSLLYSTKHFAIFSDILIGKSSATPRKILDGKNETQGIKQLGVSFPFMAYETNNRLYAGKLVVPVGFYEKQKMIPTVNNGFSLTDSFFSNWYAQYAAPESPGIMLESQYENFMLTMGYFKPEELNSEFELNVGGLAPVIPLIPPGTTFPFFSGAADIVVDNRGTNPFPQKLYLPISTQRHLYYASLMYDNTKDFIGKVEWLRNNPDTYTKFEPANPNDIIRTYNKETLDEIQDYYRIGVEKRLWETNYVKLEAYLEEAELYDGYKFKHRADAIGYSRAYNSYTIHTSYVYWHESIIGQSRELSAGVSTTIGNDTTIRMMYRRMEGAIVEPSFRAGTNDPQFKAFYEALEVLNPGFAGLKINSFELDGLELRLRYNF